MKKILFSIAALSGLTILSAQNISEQYREGSTAKTKQEQSTLSKKAYSHIAAKADETILWSDDFDDKDISDWTLYDEDGDGYEWSSVQSTDNDGNPVGSPLITSASYMNYVGPLTPDNWIVSPEIDLTSVGTGETVALKYGVWGSDPLYAKENYAVYVSTTNNPTAEATQLFTEKNLTGTEAERTVDLSAYAGQKIYISFRHFDVTDQYRLNVDNVSVVKSTTATGGGDEEDDNVIFYDGFEAYDDFVFEDFGDWKQVDLDGGQTWAIEDTTFDNQNYVGAGIIFNNSAAENGTLPTYKGNKGLYFFASGANGTAYPNDDWSITPKISLDKVKDAKLELYAQGNQIYGPDQFNIGVSTTPNVEDFVFLNSTEIVPPGLTWTKYEFDLSAYEGKEIYLAINCTTDDGLVLMIDEFKVTGTKENLGLSSDLSKSKVALYPNPVTNSFELKLDQNYNTSKVKVTIADMTGRKVKSFANAASYNVSDLSAGIYVVTVSDGAHTFTQKLIKK
ncbi:choice-of-anchor J domain-containing protein [Empedobacter falsenii]